MGVNISELLPKKEIKFENLAGKTIAIDYFNMAYQFLSSIRQRDGTPLMDKKGNITSVYVGLFSRLTRLITYGIRLCVVFDGVPPKLKAKEQEERKLRKDEAMFKLKEAIAREDIEEMYKYSKRTSYLTKDMIEDSKLLLKAMGIPVVQAPSEADAQMAYMNKNGDVWGCATNDIDPLLHGAPRLIMNLTFAQKRKLPSGNFIFIYPKIIELENVLQELSIDIDRLIALAILVGTDYNPEGVPGIGPKRALDIVKRYKKIKTIFEEIKPEFDWEEIFGLFKKMPVEKKYRLEWKEPDEEKIKELLVEKHDFSPERVENTLEKLKKEFEKKKQTGLSKWL